MIRSFVVPDFIRVEIAHDDRRLSSDKLSVALDSSNDCLDVTIVGVCLCPNSKEQERYWARYLYWDHKARYFLCREWLYPVAGRTHYSNALLEVITEPKQCRIVMFGPWTFLNNAERWRKFPSKREFRFDKPTITIPG